MTEANPRVFISLELPRELVRLVNLYTFGDIVYVFHSHEKPDVWADRTTTELIRRLEVLKFDPDVDFYAASGIMSLSHVTLGTLVDMFGAINCLLYDKRAGKYRVKTVGE